MSVMSGCEEQRDLVILRFPVLFPLTPVPYSEVTLSLRMQMELQGLRNPRSWVRIPSAPLRHCRIVTATAVTPGAVAQPGRARNRFIDISRDEA